MIEAYRLSLFSHIVLAIKAVLSIINESDNFINTIKENYLILIILLISALVLSLNEVIADRIGITKRLYLIPLLSKTKTWREIKCYAHVKEVYNGSSGQSSVGALWFIDFNDKVCLRIHKNSRLNLPDVLKIIEKFEDQHEVSLEIKNPYLMSKGWSKVDYTSVEKNT